MWSPGSNPCTTAVAAASPEECRGFFAAFQIGQTFFQRAAVRIVVARIAVAPWVLAVGTALESGGQADGRRNRAGGWIDVAAGVDRAGFNLHLYYCSFCG
jgi:hypothetical protein